MATLPTIYVLNGPNLNLLGLDPLRVAVERNLEVVPRGTLEQVCVEDGDDYEIVHFVGGG